MIKRAVSALCSVILLSCLCGCSLFNNETDNLLSPPRASGEYAVISAALKKSITGKYTIKYPSSGEYRSAIIMQDLNRDGTDEAIAFYSTTVDNTVTIHINLIAKIDGTYVSVGDSKLVGSGVERVGFCDMNGDSRQEIVVGYNIYGNVDKQVAVYEFSGNALVQRALEKYTEFIACDLDGDGTNGLLIALLNSTEKTSVAKLLQIGSDGVTEKGVCPLDGNITSYSAPVLTKLPSGRPAVLLDAVKGSGMITEILYYSDGALKNPLYNPESLETTATLRQSMVASRDINGDGITEIPMLYSLPQAGNIPDTGNVSLTKWCVLSANGLVVVRTMLMNYTDGYTLDISSELEDKICVAKKTDSRLRVVYTYDIDNKAAANELFRIITVAEKTWDADGYDKDGFAELSRANGLVYAYRLSDYSGDEAVPLQKLTAMFELIKED